MPYSPSDFRRLCPILVHYAPHGQLRPERGLLTAAQVLDRNADADRRVWAKFLGEEQCQAYDVDHWKTHSRFRRGAGEVGSNLLVRDREDETTFYILGNNSPLGDGSHLGVTLPLTDNRPGDPTPSPADWFRTLNSMFWVFDTGWVNAGVLDHLRAASPNKRLSKILLPTSRFSDEFIEGHVRLSAINGGGSNGAFARGTATYKKPSEWDERKAPKEIGILDGIQPAQVMAMGLLVEDG